MTDKEIYLAGGCFWGTEHFYPADEYHQDYLDKHPDGYCHLPRALFAFARQARKRIEELAHDERQGQV